MQNVGGEKHWQIWQSSIDHDLPKFYHPNIVNSLICNRALTQFAEVFPSKYTCKVILPIFSPANILCYTIATMLSHIEN